MIQISNTDGKTKETAIVITEAEDTKEARAFYWQFLENYRIKHGYERWEAEEVGDTLDQLIAIHRFYKGNEVVDQLWIDYTIFFNKMR